MADRPGGDETVADPGLADPTVAARTGAARPGSDRPSPGESGPSGRIERLTAWSDRATASGVRWLRGRLAGMLWLAGASLLAVGALGFGTVQAMSQVAHEERTEESTIEATGVAGLVVDNDAGEVEIVAVEGTDEVTVRARISEGLRATGHEIATRDGMLMIRGSCPIIWSDWCAVDYSIEVPPDLYVDVRALGGIELTGQTAGLRAHSVTGAVDMTRVGGEVTVSANQARIEGRRLTATRVDATTPQGHVILDFAAAPEHVRAHADQGRVDIVVPDDPTVFYDADTRAPQGSTSADVRTNPDSDRTIVAQANQGSITIAYGAG